MGQMGILTNKLINTEDISYYSTEYVLMGIFASTTMQAHKSHTRTFYIFFLPTFCFKSSKPAGGVISINPWSMSTTGTMSLTNGMYT